MTTTNDDIYDTHPASAHMRGYSEGLDFCPCGYDIEHDGPCMAQQGDA